MGDDVMKRLLLILCALTLLLSGCSFGRKPVDLSNDCYTMAINILDVTDDYLDGTITAVVAAGQIQDLCRTLSGIPNEEGSKNQLVTSYCEMLSYTLMLVADGDYINAKEILHTRNSLAELLGKAPRDN